MPKKIGGIWVVYDDLSQSLVDRRFSGNVGIVNMYLPAKFLPSKSSCLSILSATPESIDYVAVVTAGNRAGDMEMKYVFGPALAVEKWVLTENILSALSPKFSRYAELPRRRAVSVPPASWDALLKLVCKHGGISDREIQGLKNIIESRKRDRTASLPETVQHERDAVAVALDIFGGSTYRQKYLSASPASGEAPFIQALAKSDVAVLEDRMIEHDIETFPGTTTLSRHVVGAVKIEIEKGSLTIVNANRTRIEKTLGVDLVYYNNTFNSFVMVQYKRLHGDPDQIYRPNADRSYKAEIERMKTFLRTNPSTNGDCNYTTYRLQTDPFFFKFCGSRQQGIWSARMLPGMYLPLGLWVTFLESDAAKGPRNGIFIGCGTQIGDSVTLNSLN